MNRRVLCVDDEPNVLEALERTLFERFEVDTATSGPAALSLVAEETYAVVVSDMRMPEMSGARLLSEIRRRAPDTVRILLTGHADLDDAIAAVNEAGISRFLTKPCPADQLIVTLEEAVEHHRLRTAERELLNGTLGGAMNLLVDVLNLAAPELFARASRIQKYVDHLLGKLHVEDSWHYGLAGVLSQLGCAALPKELVARALAGAELSPRERDTYEGHPETAYRLLVPIPRLEPVARMIRLQGMKQIPEEESPEVRLGAELLQLAVALDARLVRGEPLADALSRVARLRGDLRRDLIDALRDLEQDDLEQEVRYLPLKDLRIGMVLAAPVASKTGTIVLPEGKQLNLLLLERLRKFAEGAGLAEPMAVRSQRKGKG